MPHKYVILLDGTIGVGKSTMGQKVAMRLDGTFLDGDDFKAKGKPWYCSSLATCRALLHTSILALEKTSVVLIGRPVRCLDWIYFTEHLKRIEVKVCTIGLQATFENITDASRGRSFSQYELDRMVQMIHEGYGARPYSDFHIRTDQTCIEATADKLELALLQYMSGQK